MKISLRFFFFQNIACRTSKECRLQVKYNIETSLLTLSGKGKRCNSVVYILRLDFGIFFFMSSLVCTNYCLHVLDKPESSYSDRCKIWFYMLVNTDDCIKGNYFLFATPPVSVKVVCVIYM